MTRLDPAAFRVAARALPPQGVALQQLLASAPGGQLPTLIVLATLPAALPGLQLGWVCVPLLLVLAHALWHGRQRPLLPERLARFAVSRAAGETILHSIAWLVEKSGAWCRSSWPRLVHRTRRKPAALLVAAMALVILLPLPGSNLLPAVAIVVLMGGLAWRDGRAILAAAVLSLLSVAVVAALGWAAWAAVTPWFSPA